MTVVEQTIDINAPIERVFEVLTDPRRAPEWNPNIVEFGDFSGYPVAPGTSWTQTVMMLGRPTRLHCRVLQYDAPHRGVIQISGDQAGRVWTACRPLDAGTRVVQGMEFTPPGGFLGRMGIGLVKGQIEKELYGTMVRQKRAVEEDPNAR